MALKYKNKVAVVTGAARGIGKNISTKLAEAGATVIIADKNKKDGQSTVKKLNKANKNVEFQHIDLSNVKQMQEMIISLFEKYDHIDLLVNNAKASQRTSPLHETEENWELTLDVALKAPLFISQMFIKSVKQLDRGSSIINISSIAAKTITHESAAYHIAKAGINNLTCYLAVFGGPKGVRVNAISPGFIVQDEHSDKYWKDNNISYRSVAEFCHPLGRVGTSDDIANSVLFLGADEASFITGQVLTVDGGLTKQDQWHMVYNYNKMKE